MSLGFCVLLFGGLKMLKGSCLGVGVVKAGLVEFGLGGVGLRWLGVVIGFGWSMVYRYVIIVGERDDVFSGW